MGVERDEDEKKKKAKVPPGPNAEEKENAEKLGDGVPRSYAADHNPPDSSFGNTGQGGTGGG